MRLDGLDDALSLRLPKAPHRGGLLDRLVGDPSGHGRRRRPDERRRHAAAAPPASAPPPPPAASPRRPARRRRPPFLPAAHPLRHGRRPRPRAPRLTHFPAVPASVLSDGTIRRLVDEGRIVINPWEPSLVQPASIDLRLGDSFRVFHNHRAAVIDLRDGPPKGLTEEVTATPEDGFVIHPGEFCLGRTEEWVELPGGGVARIDGKSSLGGLGLFVHATAGFIDPGWKGT